MLYPQNLFTVKSDDRSFFFKVGENGFTHSFFSFNKTRQ